MTAHVTLHAGHDVAYLTHSRATGGYTGVKTCYMAGEEPPGVWAGNAAAGLGLAGRVDAKVIGQLYMEGTGPHGEILVDRQQPEEAVVAAYRAAHPYASSVELAEVRAAERANSADSAPYCDLTVTAAKSVSVLHASYRVSAMQARQSGDHPEAASFDVKAGEIETTLMESAREAIGWLEQHATYTSTVPGQWCDGDGLTAALFLHHISSDGNPHLHVHAAIWNRVQRADKADTEWYALDSRTLNNQRPAVAAITGRLMETKLTELGYAMVPRPDRNGAEVGGVSQDLIDLFTSPADAVTP